MSYTPWNMTLEELIKEVELLEKEEFEVKQKLKKVIEELHKRLDHISSITINEK